LNERSTPTAAELAEEEVETVAVATKAAGVAKL
jgi:hypothetical protein